MKKKSFLKGITVIILVGVLLGASGVFAESFDLSDDIKEIIEDFVKQKGIEEENITSIKQVDFNDLPDAINIENIDDTNLAIYEIDYEGSERPVYVITVSDEMFKARPAPSEAQGVLLLNFGFDGVMKQSDFLETATGVEGSLEKGYVMMRQGSITGISTNLEVISGSGQIEIIIYRNGENVQFGNTFVVNSSEVMKDYDIESEDTVKFEAGDVISVYAKAQGNVVWKDVITIVEITVAKNL